MKLEEIAGIIEEKSPLSLQEDWDNSGFQLNLQGEADTVLVALEVNRAVIDEAISVGAQLIVTHHPLLFEPIRCVDNKNIIGDYIVQLIQHGISLYASHTPFDRCSGGNNDELGRLLHLQNLRLMETDDTGICRLGDADAAYSVAEYVAQISKWLGLESRYFTLAGDPDAKVRRVGLCTGAGTSYLEAAAQAGCDLFVTGDVKYHTAQAAREMHVNLLDLGHFGTEQIFTANMAEYLRSRCSVNVVESSVNLNPFHMF